MGNQALKLSCESGLPVRVVRSHKEKRSAYAPPDGVRYDGVYRIAKCWRKQGARPRRHRPTSSQRLVLPTGPTLPTPPVQTGQ